MTAANQAPDLVDVLFGGFLGAFLASLVPLFGEAWWRRAKRLECMPVLDYVYELREMHAPPNPMKAQGKQKPIAGATQAVKFGFLERPVTDAMGHEAFDLLTADGQRAWRIHNRRWKIWFRMARFRVKRVCGLKAPTAVSRYTRLSTRPPEHRVRRKKRKRMKAVERQDLLRCWGRGTCWSCEKWLAPWNDTSYCRSCREEQLKALRKRIEDGNVPTTPEDGR